MEDDQELTKLVQMWTLNTPENEFVSGSLDNVSVKLSKIILKDESAEDAIERKRAFNERLKEERERKEVLQLHLPFPETYEDLRRNTLTAERMMRRPGSSSTHYVFYAS